MTVKTKVDRYVKVERHYKDEKAYYTINLFSENADEPERLRTHKKFPFLYQTQNKMTADSYAYKIGRCLEVPVRN